MNFLATRLFELKLRIINKFDIFQRFKLKL
jgi:hypothetical protein